MKTSQPSKPNKTLVNLALALGQRLAFGVLVLVFIIFLSHLGLDMARGTDFQPAAVRAVEKTVAYLGQLMRGDLGLSMAGSISLLPVSVAEMVPDMLFRSLGLLFTSLSFAAVVGIILGIWAAKRAHSGWSLIAILASIIGVSVPSFLAALLLQLAVIRLTQVMGHAILPVGGFGWDKHIIIPALVLAARPLAQITRVTFVIVSNVLEQDYIRTAHSKGLRQRRVMSRHVIRNAAIAILTTVGLSLRFSLSSLPVVEFIFGWPGLGFTLLKTIALRDDNLTVALVLCLGILFILVNILLDFSYRLIDPRSRETPEFIKRGERRNLLEWGQSALA
ncbi:MAG: ABC transporter permease, partial [Chloroflexota bacterium]